MSDALRILFENEQQLRQTMTKEVPRAGVGTVFPTGITSGHRFYRTDLDLDTYYDGTRWLTVNLFESNLQSYPRNPMPIAAGVGAAILLSAQRTDYATYYVRAKAYLDVITTNDATNYWSYSLVVGTTTVVTANTSAAAPNVGIHKEDTSAQVCAGALYAYVAVTKVLAPGNFVCHMTYWYRLIIT